MHLRFLRAQFIYYGIEVFSSSLKHPGFVEFRLNCVLPKFFKPFWSRIHIKAISQNQKVRIAEIILFHSVFFKIIKRANSSPYYKVLIDNAHIKAFLQNRITIKMGFWSEHLTNHSSIFNRLSHMRLQKIEKSVKFPPFGISFLNVC